MRPTGSPGTTDVAMKTSSVTNHRSSSPSSARRTVKARSGWRTRQLLTRPARPGRAPSEEGARGPSASRLGGAATRGRSGSLAPATVSGASGKPVRLVVVVREAELDLRRVRAANVGGEAVDVVVVAPDHVTALLVPDAVHLDHDLMATVDVGGLGRLVPESVPALVEPAL